jgi:hypothetical protein
MIELNEHQRREVMGAEKNGYSADVRMTLCVNGRSFRIGQLGPDFLILDDPAELPPTQGEITVSIDGHVRRWQVKLPDGVSSARQISPMRRCAV